MDTLAVSVSTGLQYGVPLRFSVDKFSHVRFEPSGWTGNPQVPYAKSIIDYLFRWLGKRFLGLVEPSEAGETPQLRPTEPAPQVALPFESVSDAPLLLGMRRPHHSQRFLLQMRELRRYERLVVASVCSRGRSRSAPSGFSKERTPDV